MRSLAARRAPDRAGHARRARPGRRLPAGRARAQDRHGLHQARRSAPRPGDRGLATPPAVSAEEARCQDRRGSRRPLLRSRPAGGPQLPQPDHHPGPLSEGWRPSGRRARQDHEPPCPLHHRQPALQRQGADDAVRAPDLARASESGEHPALRKDQPHHLVEGLPRRRLLRPQPTDDRGPLGPRRRHFRACREQGTLAALRPRPRLLQLLLLEQCPHRMACARCDFTSPRPPAALSSSRAPRTSSACLSPSRSPTTSGPQSRTGMPSLLRSPTA